MSCNACARFLLCDKKTCNFKRIRDIEVRRQENENRRKSDSNLYRHSI